MSTIDKALEKHSASMRQQQTERELQDEKQLENIQSAPEKSVVEQKTEAGSETTTAAEKAAARTATESNVIEARVGDTTGPFLDIDAERLIENGFIIPDDKRSKIKEEYKHIKRPLLRRTQKPRSGFHDNIIMVTSCFSGEGKTYTALNLALSMALEKDSRVLLIDADVVKPSLGNILGAKERKGLVDYLTGDITDIGKVLCKTNIPNLRFIPSGKTHHLTHELLASNTMENLVNDLATRYPDRVVILDSPPLLVTSEASVLSNLVGQISLVVEQDKTSQSSVKDALSKLDEDRVTGLILNKSTSTRSGYYGYYYSDVE